MSLLDAYDRQRHLAWHEEHHPGAAEWPPCPGDSAAAARYIAQYAGLAGLLEILLGLGLEVSFTKDPEGYVVIIDDHAAGLSTGIGETVTGALEAAVTGLGEPESGR